MKYFFIIPALSLLGSAMGDVINDYNTEWNPNTANADYSTLTPTGTPLGDTDATGTYVISLETFDSEKKMLVKRRNKHQKNRNIGQKLKNNNKTKSSKKSAKDQFDAAKAKKHRKDALVTQIDDGQIQAGTSSDIYYGNGLTTTTSSCDSYIITSYSSSCWEEYSATQDYYNTDPIVTQINDGQIQWSDNQDVPDAPVYTETYTECTQVPFYITSQDCNTVPYETPTTYYPETSTVPPSCYQESDGQVHAYISGSLYDDDGTSDSVCSSDVTFSFTIADGILYDQEGRIGSIVSNTQFQFDGPPPQAGAIYAAGWSITDDYYLAYGDQYSFVACPQDDDYKIYIDYPYDSCFEVMVKVSEVIDSC